MGTNRIDSNIPGEGMSGDSGVGEGRMGKVEGDSSDLVFGKNNIPSERSNQLTDAVEPRRVRDYITPSAQAASGGLGFALVLAYMFFDVVRPGFTWHFPKIFSVLIFLAWVGQPNKKFPRQVVYMLLIVAEMFFDVPLAANNYKAFWSSYGMGMLAVSFCIPFIHFVNSKDRFQVAMNVLIGIYLVIGVWACFDKGYGPGGIYAAQDENYVATWMAMAIPLTLYASLASVSLVTKLVYLAPIPIFSLAVVVGENPSRGGVLGILTVLAYAVFYSKKRILGLVGIGVIGVFVLAVAGATFWAEMGTMGETDSGTASHRKDLWMLATRMFLSNPITGVGPENFQWSIGDYQTAEDIAKYKRDLSGSAVTHSLYFEMLADLGSVGVFLFSMITLQNFRDVRSVRKSLDRVARENDTASQYGVAGRTVDEGTLKWLQYYSYGMEASFIGLLVCSAFLSTFYLSYFWLQSALIAAFKLVADRLLPMGSPSAASRKISARQRRTEIENAL